MLTTYAKGNATNGVMGYPVPPSLVCSCAKLGGIFIASQ